MRYTDDPTLYGRIPDPPERESECCGNCKYNTREKKDTFSCGNEDGEHYGDYTDYLDYCELWEGKDGTY